MEAGKTGAGDGPKAMRVLWAIVLGALSALSVGAASASAEPFTMTFTEARANAGTQLSDAALLEPPNTAPFGAELDPQSGSISADALVLPRFSDQITDPIETELTVDLEIDAISGSFIPSTGALSLNGTMNGTLTTSGSECALATDPPLLTLSTAGNNGGAGPRSGAPFTAGLTGPGEIAGQWNDMSATPVTPADAFVCSFVDSRLTGPGGIWLKQAVVVPPPTPQSPSPNPTSRGPSGTPQSAGDAPPPTPACIVPKLVGKAPAPAKAALKAAGCRLGEIRKPKLKGKKRPALVVKSSNPAAGKPAEGKVQLQLGPKR